MTEEEIKLIEESKSRIKHQTGEEEEVDGCKFSIETYTMKENDADEIYELRNLDETMIRDEFEPKHRIKWSRNYAEIFDAWEYSLDFLEENGYLPIEVEKLTLEKLSMLDKSSLLYDIAKNEKTPIFILEKLAQNEDQFVRMYVARNTKCPEHLLELLSKSSYPNTRKNVASNLNTSTKLLNSLIYDKYEDTRIELAKNPNFPKKSLIKLKKYEKELEDKLYEKLDKLFDGFRDEEIDAKWLGRVLTNMMRDEGKDLNQHCRNILDCYGIFQSRLEVDGTMYYKVYYRNDGGDGNLNDKVIFRDNEQESHDAFNAGLMQLLATAQERIDESGCEDEE